MLAAQEPWSEPGTASEYQALNQGYLVGEVMRRITGQQPGAFLAAEVAGPLGADFHIGTGPEHWDRMSPVVSGGLDIDPSAIELDSVMMKTFTGPAPEASVSWTPGWRQADNGAANRQGNARSVATIQAVLAQGGEHNGVRLLSEETCRLALDEQIRGGDLVLDVPVVFGLGYGFHECLPFLPEGTCWWGGWGGSIVVVDQARRVTMSYVMNRMGDSLVGDVRAGRLLDATYASLG